MELGARIRQARLDAGLSQRQLCGDTITRNMLSLIESGKARPSMDTLAYLACRLGKPVAYFLEEQAVTSPNQQIMDSARAAYTSGQHRQALEVLEAYRAPDGVFDAERWLIGALCLMELARSALTDGKHTYARALLEKVRQTGSQSVYYTPALERQRLLLMYEAAPDTASVLEQQLPELAPELVLRARAAMDTGDCSRCAALLDAAQHRDAGLYLLRGQAAMAMDEYAAAAKLLHQAEGQYPMECARLLETCYRELEDYKRAYEYACKQR